MQKDISYKINHIKSFFSEIVFNEDLHRYTVQEKELKPVSNCLKYFQEEFDSEVIATRSAIKEGSTKQEVLKKWKEIADEACRIGTETHLFAETFKELGLKPKNNLQKAVVKFWDNLPKHLIPVFYELRMYSKELNIAGTTDLVFYNTKTNKFILADYKTNKDLFKNFAGKKLLKPFDDLLDNPFNKYQLQLSLYKILFELTGYEIQKSALIWLKQDGNYEILYTKDYSKILKERLQ